MEQGQDDSGPALTATLMSDFASMNFVKQLISDVRLWDKRSARLAASWTRLNERLQHFGIDPVKMRILDLGCGAFYPYTLLYNSIGCDVMGVDLLQMRSRKMNLARIRHDLANRGPGRVSKSLANNLRVRFFWDSKLAAHARVSLNYDNLKLCVSDAAALSICDNAIDLVVSYAAVEHFLDLSGVMDEIYRILSPGGIVHLNIHLWTSLSGGHEEVFWGGGIPQELEVPWRHLRDETWTTPIPLNRLRQDDYLRQFETRFEILETQVESELGRELISPQILDALPDFSADELAAELWVVILRKPV